MKIGTRPFHAYTYPGGADVACSLYRCLHTGAVDSLVNIILAENGIELVAEGESHHQPFC